MKKILKLMSVIAISFELQVWSTEHDYSVTNCNYNLLSNYFKYDNEELISLVRKDELPYNCTYQDAEADPEFKGKWYYFMKKSFHMLYEMNKDHKLTEEFFNSTKDERDLIIENLIALEKSNPELDKFEKSLVYSPNSSGLPTWYKFQFVLDIIHNNIYSVVIDELVKEYNEKYSLIFTKTNKDQYWNNVYNIINEVDTKIKHPIRRNIVKNALKDYWEHNNQENINWDNYNNYCVKISGMQDDIYDKNHSYHIRCSGFSLKDLLQLLLSSNSNLYKHVIFNETYISETELDKMKTRDISYYINKFDRLVDECYITNPIIKKFSCMYYALNHFDALSLSVLLQKEIKEKIYSDFCSVNIDINKLSDNKIIDNYIKIIEDNEDAQFFFVQQTTYNIFKMKEIQPYMREIVRNAIKKVLNSNKSDKN